MADGELDAVGVNRVFHDHECHYYDERFAIVHDARTARRARGEVEELLGRPLRAGEWVLDVGCGTGYLAAGLRRAAPETRVVGVDLSAGMLERARIAGAYPLVHGDATRLPLADGSVDLVVARGVLHHLPDVAGALGEWRRVLQPAGAVVLLSEPTPVVERHGAALVRVLLRMLRNHDLTPEAHYWELASMAANLHVFTAAELRALARDAGFTQVALTTADLVSTLVLTASYVVWGRAPDIARRLPWRAAEAAGRAIDRLITQRVVPASHRHTVLGVLHR
ncbi:MAG: methyltransferase domain-containing protein [Mycobacteriales bacterium]|nr:methyltransferase domain-containing protein [Frankia sp.]